MIIRNDVRRGLFCTLLVFITTVSANDALMCTIAGPTSTSQVIYSEGLSPAWSVDAIHSTQKVTFDLVSTIAGRTGLFALRATFPSAWSYLILERRDYERTYGKKALVLRIRGVQNTSVNGQLWIRLRDFNYDWFDEAVPVARYMINADANGNFNSNTWYTVVIPIKDLGAENTIITGLILESGNASTYYLDDVWLVQGLEFPLKGIGDGAYTTIINAVMDHNRHADKAMRDKECPNNVVTAYTGDEGRKGVGNVAGSDFSLWSYPTCSSTLRGLPQDVGLTPFLVGGQYDIREYNEFGKFLFYDGHAGTDYPKDDGTAVFAAGEGYAYRYSFPGMDSNTEYPVRIDHGNGYQSYYLHMSKCSVADGAYVRAGDQIGEVGQKHLHFQLRLWDELVDPYGWTDSQPDPLRRHVVSVPLWR